MKKFLLIVILLLLSCNDPNGNDKPRIILYKEHVENYIEDINKRIIQLDGMQTNSKDSAKYFDAFYDEETDKWFRSHDRNYDLSIRDSLIKQIHYYDSISDYCSRAKLWRTGQRSAFEWQLETYKWSK